MVWRFRIVLTVCVVAGMVAGPPRMEAPLTIRSRDVTVSEVQSQDRRMSLSFLVNEDQKLSYFIDYQGVKLLEESTLGLIVDDVDLCSRVVLEVGRRRAYDKTYEMLGGVSEADNSYRSRHFFLSHPRLDDKYEIEGRAFSDGVAYRYRVPPGSKVDREVLGEISQLKFPVGSEVWFRPASHETNESWKRKKVENLTALDLAETPVLVKLAEDNGYLMVGEAETAGYSGLFLRGIPGGFVTQFPEDPRGWVVEGDLVTPWRVFVYAKTLDGIVNSTAITNLAEAPDPANFPAEARSPWIEPGRCVWPWMAEGGERGVNPDNIRLYNELAGELAFEYNLVPQGWEDWEAPEEDAWTILTGIVEHAKMFGVRLWVWKSVIAPEGHTGLEVRKDRRAFLAKCAEVGVAGVQVGFPDLGSREANDVLREILRDAADFKIMVAIDGGPSPAGESRTWPHLLARADFRNLTQSPTVATGWSRHNTTLPFTRFAVGHGDYRPVQFGPLRRETSQAHQLAGAVVFTSPLQIYAENPQNLLDSPVAEFVKAIPTVWDETRVLEDSAVGEVVAFARRSRNDWFIAIMNGPEAREITVGLHFLDGGNYLGQIITDEGSTLGIERQTTTRDQSLNVSLPPHGGYLARFAKVMLSPAGGNFSASRTVHIESADPDAEFIMTLDGETPTNDRARVASPLTLTDSADLRVKVFTYDESGHEAHGRFNRIPAKPPLLLPIHTVHNTPPIVRIKTLIENAQINITLDGTEPDRYSARYTGPFYLKETAMIKAMVTAPGLKTPLYAERHYIIQPKFDMSILQLRPIEARGGRGHLPTVNYAITGRPLQVNGTPFANGIGVFSQSEIIYPIKSNFKRFVGIGAVDDSAGPSATVKFEIHADHRLIAESPILQRGGVHYFDVELPENVTRLRLIVSDGGDGQTDDVADWITPGVIIGSRISF